MANADKTCIPCCCAYCHHQRRRDFVIKTSAIKKFAHATVTYCYPVDTVIYMDTITYRNYADGANRGSKSVRKEEEHEVNPNEYEYEYEYDSVPESSAR